MQILIEREENSHNRVKYNLGKLQQQDHFLLRWKGTHGTILTTCIVQCKSSHGTLPSKVSLEKERWDLKEMYSLNHLFKIYAYQ